MCMDSRCTARQSCCMLTSNSYVLDEAPARLAALEPVPLPERIAVVALRRRDRFQGGEPRGGLIEDVTV